MLSRVKLLARFDRIIISKRCYSIEAWDEPMIDHQITPELRKKIDEHWRHRLPPQKFDENSEKKKFYILSMIPYPSGSLHMGHVRVYCISDAIARFNRMRGRNVLHPMGWDAFGLPAENAALENNVAPDKWTEDNITNMKKQMEKLNISFDWDREIKTNDPEFYKWTQYLFLKLYENGLVYRKKAVVNWDPIDQTVLADEQIDNNGRCWRSGAVVEKKLLTQWFIKTSKFMKALSDGLKDQEISIYWESVGSMQMNFLADCKGYTFDFKIEENSKMQCDYMTIWVKAPEYINQGKFIAVKRKSMWDVGSDSSGLLPYKVIHPFTGSALPVYVTDDVVYPLGAEIYLGIPELVEEDKIFAKTVNISFLENETAVSDEECLKLREEICKEALSRNIGGYQTGPRNDWLISRQRYWGTPIPLIHCKKCDVQPVPESELPVKLPKINHIKKGTNHLAEAEEWYKTTCPKCGGEAVRETDTMDTFVDSSWYFLRYLENKSTDAPFCVEKAKKFMPVDLYIGGGEHAVTHLYYARFFNYFLHSLGLLDEKEPFQRLLPQGWIKGRTFQSSKTGEYIRPHLVDFKNNSAVHKETGENLIVTWDKMSKSKYNGVDPDDLIAEHGVDTTRLLILSEVAPRKDRNWDDKILHGIFKFQNRLWEEIKILQDVRKKNLSIEDEENFKSQELFLSNSRNYYTEKITKCFTVSYNINYAIKYMQELIKKVRKSSEDVAALSGEHERALASVIIFLTPVAPCFASELWAGLLKAPNRICKNGKVDWETPLLLQAWPKCDEGYSGKFQGDLGIENEESGKESNRSPPKAARKRNKKLRKIEEACLEDLKEIGIAKRKLS